MIPVIALMLAVSMTAAEQPTLNLHCADLSPELVCLAAGRGFGFNDGCNGVTCSSDGLATATLKACRAPATEDERTKCDHHARSVWRRLGPFTCPNVEPSTVCKSRGTGFAFSDGCNRIRCMQDGTFASTRMHCPVTDPVGPYCRLIAAAIAEPEQRSGPIIEETQQQWECPKLHFSKVCAEYLPSFAYNDGCRKVRCLADGQARLPIGGRDCPEAPAGNAAAATYCDAAERRMLEKKAKSSFFTTCLQPDLVCKESRTADLTFFDGCNRCFCLPDRNAACTRVACPPRFQTPDEFAEHCKRVGAGAVPPQK